LPIEMYKVKNNIVVHSKLKTYVSFNIEVKQKSQQIQIDIKGIR